MSEENKINSVTSSVDTGTSIKFIGESDSTGNNLRIEDGKLSGTIVGSVIKDFTGRVDDVTLELTNVPIDGIGGGSDSGEPEIALIADGLTLSGSNPTSNGIGFGYCTFKSFKKEGQNCALGDILNGKRINNYYITHVVGGIEYEIDACINLMLFPESLSDKSGSPSSLTTEEQQSMTSFSLTAFFFNDKTVVNDSSVKLYAIVS